MNHKKMIDALTRVVLAMLFATIALFAFANLAVSCQWGCDSTSPSNLLHLGVFWIGVIGALALIVSIFRDWIREKLGTTGHKIPGKNIVRASSTALSVILLVNAALNTVKLSQGLQVADLLAPLLMYVFPSIVVAMYFLHYSVSGKRMFLSGTGYRTNGE